MPEWQAAASNVLVALGNQFCNEVMGDLIQKFQPGVLPHFFVVQTMANLASENGKFLMHDNKYGVNFFKTMHPKSLICEEPTLNLLIVIDL